MRIPEHERSQVCAICARVAHERTRKGGGIEKISCLHCGDYRVDALVSVDLDTPDADELRPFLAAYIRQANRRGEDVTLTLETWRQRAGVHKGTTVPKKLQLLLEHLAKKSTHGGELVTLEEEEHPLIDLTHPAEANYCLDMLVRRGHIEEHGPSRTYRILPDGWERLDPHARGGELGRCFVGMWFDPTRLSAWTEGIKLGVERAGLNPIRIDLKQFNGSIIDEVLAEIRRCQVTIVDLTGHRNGVYFEAGFAKGLGREVIFCCRKDQLDDAHFDVRPLNMIDWQDPAELAARLENRLRATVTIPVSRK